jgi:hypothetical protein
VVTEAASPDGLAGPVLVATKLHVPVARAGLVSRGELVGRLTGAGERKLVLVCAPAGWGKTSVLSQWHAAAGPGVFAWVSLDPGDDDRVRFWSYVIGAVRTVAPGVGEAALAALPNAAGDLAGAVLPSLLNELAAAGRRLVLVLVPITVCGRSRSTPRSPFCSVIFPRTCSWRSRLGLIRRSRWAACAPRARSWRSAPRSFASARPRPGRC